MRATPSLYVALRASGQPLLRKAGDSHRPGIYLTPRCRSTDGRHRETRDRSAGVRPPRSACSLDEISGRRLCRIRRAWHASWPSVLAREAWRTEAEGADRRFLSARRRRLRAHLLRSGPRTAPPQHPAVRKETISPSKPVLRRPNQHSPPRQRHLRRYVLWHITAMGYSQHSIGSSAFHVAWGPGLSLPATR